MTKLIEVLFIVLIIAPVIWLLPLAAIWALNTLFELTIPFEFKEYVFITAWAAALVLIATFGPNNGVKK